MTASTHLAALSTLHCRCCELSPVRPASAFTAVQPDDWQAAFNAYYNTPPEILAHNVSTIQYWGISLVSYLCTIIS